MRLDPSSFLFTGGVAWALLFVVPLFLFLYWRLYRYRQRVFREWGACSVASCVMRARSPWIYWAKAVSLSLVWCLAMLALMQPKGNPHYPGLETAGVDEVKRNSPHEVIILLDLSRSMDVADGQGSVTRLEEAKEIVEGVIRGLRGERVSLYPFNAEAWQAVPPTANRLYARLKLSELSVGQKGAPGTRLAPVLEMVQERQWHPEEGVRKTMLILSDGGDADWEGEEKENAVKRIREAFGDSDLETMRLFVIGLGSEEGGVVPDVRTAAGGSVTSYIDEEFLRTLSSSGGGQYFSTEEQPGALIAQEILSQVASPFEQRDLERRASFVLYDAYFQIPLGVAIVLLTACLLFPDRRRSYD